MNSKQLKYAEVFSFLAFIFFLLFIFLSHEGIKLEANVKELKTNVKGYKQQNINLKGQSERLEQENEDLEAQNENLQREYAKIIEENQALKIALEKSEQSGKYNKGKYPPNITIENTGQYAFPLGQGKLTPTLETFITQDIVAQIKQNFEEYSINTIEVIGHTDGSAIKGNSNLDQSLNQIAIQNTPIENLQPGSNTDLGLIRALAVIKALQQEEELLQLFEEKGIDKNKVFRAYSAGQLYLPEGTIAPPDPNANKNRRRIEIRFTKLQ